MIKRVLIRHARYFALSKILFLLMIGCLEPIAFAAWEAPGAEPVDLQTSFLFSEHVAEAETWAMDRDRKTVVGDWVVDRFLFPDLGGRADVRKIVQNTEAGQTTAIRFNPVKGVKRWIRFYDVPSGSKLVLTYRMVMLDKPEKVSYLNFRIWAGNHELSYLRIRVESSWEKEVIPLKFLSFWDREMVMTFELYTESSEDIVFNFSASVEP